ncbi:MAG: hypothetical protein M0042_10595 [Nitrospiraceae bacterium]|nr:hypothetical protein [Nitrospiraceae bacterium]
MSLWKRVIAAARRINGMSRKLQLIQESLGRIESRQIVMNARSADEAEFKVYSQWGEDGIIQYLIANVPIERKLFVEFGVENYRESNTRFLLINNYWAGLVIDGSAENIQDIRNDMVYWGYNLKADHAFITRDNINELITRNGLKGDIGILSVDIDGNDYWVWEAITSVNPRIVICEYNSLFGPRAKVSTPYDPAFVRDRAHYSKVYYGASISALHDLANRKGYSLVAGNSAGNNVFFVRNDLLGNLKAVAPEKCYRRSCFREFHDQQGNLTFDDFETRLSKIGDLPVFDFSADQVARIKDVAGIGD